MSSTAPTNVTNPVAAPHVPQLRFREALEATRAEIAALPAEKILPINIDVRAATVTAFGCLPELKPYRDRMAALPDFDIGKMDNLERYAHAVAQANANYLAASQPLEPVEELADQLVDIRSVLVSDAEALAKRELVDGSRLGELKGPVGYNADLASR